MSDRRLAVVTGASQGIGKAVVELLRSEGWETVGLARRFQDTGSTRRMDVRDPVAVEKTFKALIAERGRLDALVNCAGIVTTTEALETGVDEWMDVFRTNVVGTWLCCQNALPAMCERRCGKIINLSSIAGRLYSEKGSPAYTASKYAVIGLTKHLAARFGACGLNINCVCPSQTKTEMLSAHVPAEKQAALAAKNPMRRLAEPGEIAAVIAFLASEKASYINGGVIDVNGGLL